MVSNNTHLRPAPRSAVRLVAGAGRVREARAYSRRWDGPWCTIRG